MSLLYHFIVSLLDLTVWDGRLEGEARLPKAGPVVFIANHHEALGPIAAVCALPMRLRFWVVADMVDPLLAPAWLQWDFVERTLHLKPPASAWVARALARLTVPLLRSLGGIAVYKRDYERLSGTLRESLQVLLQGQFLLVFPEDNLLPRDPRTQMSPFQRTFARLGEMYYEETKERLIFQPLTIHPKGIAVLGEPVLFDPANPPGLERHRLLNTLEEAIRSTYLALEDTPAEDLPLTAPGQ